MELSTNGEFVKLKEVLELIDERINKAKMDIQNAFESDYGDYPNIEKICLGVICELEELKKRIF